MMRFIATIQAILIAIKMAGLTTHSWWWILTPAWATLIFGLILLFIFLLVIPDGK